MKINMIILKVLICGLGFVFFGCSFKKAPQWEPLFNGKNLEGWQVKLQGHKLHENFGNTFRVEDGILQVRYDQYDTDFGNKYGHLFYEEPFSSYLIAVEYRFTGEQIKGPGEWAYRNSGIMIHGQDPLTMGENQSFPNSIEVQLLGGNGKGDRPTANICTPGTQFVMDGEIIQTHCINSTSPTFEGEEWVRVEVLVLRDSLVTHFVNGEEVLRYEKPQTDPLPGQQEGEFLTEGSISLQSESHPIDFRKVEIVNLEEYEKDSRELKSVVDRLISKKRVAKN